MREFFGFYRRDCVIDFEEEEILEEEKCFLEKLGFGYRRRIWI